MVKRIRWALDIFPINFDFVFCPPHADTYLLSTWSIESSLIMPSMSIHSLKPVIKVNKVRISLSWSAKNREMRFCWYQLDQTAFVVFWTVPFEIFRGIFLLLLLSIFHVTVTDTVVIASASDREFYFCLLCMDRYVHQPQKLGGLEESSSHDLRRNCISRIMVLSRQKPDQEGNSW